MKGEIISREFVRPLPSGHELKYLFQTFEFVLKGKDSLDRYLKTCYESGVPELAEIESASQCRTPVAKVKQIKNHPLIELAKEADYRGRGYKQHSIVQNYLLANDRATIATEVPLFMTADETPNGKNWGGHLDILRIENNKFQIIDFKPKANKEKWAGSQVLRYMLMFSGRTAIPLDLIEGIYFDDEFAFSVNF